MGWVQEVLGGLWRWFRALSRRSKALVIGGVVVGLIAVSAVSEEPEQSVVAADSTSRTTTTAVEDLTTTTLAQSTSTTSTSTTSTSTTSTTTTEVPSSTTAPVASVNLSGHPILDPSHPGLRSVAGADLEAAAREFIAQVATKGRGPRTGYDRARFGPAWTDACSRDLLWCRNGLDTRNDILSRDLTAVECRSAPTSSSRPHCSVARGVLADPFSGESMNFDRSCCANDIHIDHLVPLSYAWQMGAAQWSEEKRIDFAIDPLNLAAVNGRLNQSKGDSDLASWLPPNRAVRCAYAVRFAAVSIKYDLANTEANRQMMLDQCGGGDTAPPPSSPPATTSVPPATTPTTAAAGIKCDPNYDPCVPDFDTYGDVNCGDVSGPVRVVGPHDPHRLDGDRDGIACE